MKNITLMMTLLFIISSTSEASCINAYQIYNVQNEKDNSGKETGKQMITSGLASLGSGGIVYVTGLTIGRVFGPTAVYLTSAYFGATITTSPVITLSGTITYLMALEYIKIQKTLKQSLYGFGAEIDELREDLEDDLGREVSINELMSVLQEANQEKTFCTDKLYKLDEIKIHLLDRL